MRGVILVVIASEARQSYGRDMDGQIAAPFGLAMTMLNQGSQ